MGIRGEPRVELDLWKYRYGTRPVGVRWQRLGLSLAGSCIGDWQYINHHHPFASRMVYTLGNQGCEYPQGYRLKPCDQ